jgi:ribosome biogenesis GTPase A
LIFVFNKNDLISNEHRAEIKRKYPKAFFVSAAKRHGIKGLRKYLDKKGEEYMGKKHKSMRIAMVGYPNVGKSSVLNLLVPEARAKVSFVSGTTKKTQWIRSKHLRFMDSPGVIPRRDKTVKVGITSSKDVEKLKNPEKIAANVIEVIRKMGDKPIEDLYKIDIIPTMDTYDVFLEIGKKRGFLLKRGEIDENRTAKLIVSDWQKGKLGMK